MPNVWMILVRALWVVLLIFSGMTTLMMFAFADTPDAGKAAKKMIAPIFFITLLLFGGSGWLLMHDRWWSIAVGYVVVLSPPVLVFVGYRVLTK